MGPEVPAAFVSEVTLWKASSFALPFGSADSVPTRSGTPEGAARRTEIDRRQRRVPVLLHVLVVRLAVDEESDLAVGARQPGAQGVIVALVRHLHRLRPLAVDLAGAEEDPVVLLPEVDLQLGVLAARHRHRTDEREPRAVLGEARRPERGVVRQIAAVAEVEERLAVAVHRHGRGPGRELEVAAPDHEVRHALQIAGLLEADHVGVQPVGRDQLARAGLLRNAHRGSRLRPRARVHRQRRPLELPVGRVQLAARLHALSRRRMALELRLLSGLEEQHLHPPVGGAAEPVLARFLDRPALAAAHRVPCVVDELQRGAEPLQALHLDVEQLGQLGHVGGEHRPPERVVDLRVVLQRGAQLGVGVPLEAPQRRVRRVADLAVDLSRIGVPAALARGPGEDLLDVLGLVLRLADLRERGVVAGEQRFHRTGALLRERQVVCVGALRVGVPGHQQLLLRELLQAQVDGLEDVEPRDGVRRRRIGAGVRRGLGEEDGAVEPEMRVLHLDDHSLLRLVVLLVLVARRRCVGRHRGVLGLFAGGGAIVVLGGAVALRPRRAPSPPPSALPFVVRGRLVVRAALRRARCLRRRA